MAEHHAESTLRNINENRQNDEYCDFAIEVKGKSFKVHRLILGSCSPYFRAMFSSKMQEARQGFVDVKNVDVDAVKQCIDFVYTGKAIPNIANVEGMIELASMWQLDKLNKTCVAYLTDSIDFESCFRIKHIATLHQFEDVERECDSFIVENMEGLVDKGNFCDLKKEYLVQYLREVMPSQTPGGSEIFEKRANRDLTNLSGLFWKFCQAWHEACAVSDVNTFCEVLQSVPIKFCKVSLIEQEVWKNSHVASCDHCKVYVAKEVLENCNTNAPCSEISEDYDTEDDLDSSDYGEDDNDDEDDENDEDDDDDDDDDDGEDTENLTPPIVSIFEDFSSETDSCEEDDDCRHDDFETLGKHQVDETNCFFLKSLSKAYEDQMVEECVDTYITNRFETLSEMPKFLEIPQDDFLSYLRSSAVGDIELQKLAKIIVKWILHDKKKRKELFKWFKPCVELLSSREATKPDEYEVSSSSFHPEVLFCMKTFAKEFDCPILGSNADKLILENLQNILKRPEFNNLDKNDLVRYVSSDRLKHISISIIWEAVVDWVKHDVAKRKDDFPDVFRSIDFTNTPTDFLKRTVCSEPIVKNSTSCKDALMGHLFGTIGRLEKETGDLKKEMSSVKERISAIENSRKA